MFHSITEVSVQPAVKNSKEQETPASIGFTGSRVSCMSIRQRTLAVSCRKV
jgi:hypothetical protein